MKLLPADRRANRTSGRPLHQRMLGTPSSPTGSESLGGGMELALTIAVFVVIGALIDRWAGTFPAFTIGMIVFAAVGSFARLKYTYDAAMERLEQERLVGRASRSGGAVAEVAPMQAAPESGGPT